MSLWKAEQFWSDGDEKAQEAPAKTAAPEWFDHHPWVPIIFLILLPFLVELPLAVLGLSTNPIWFDSAAVIGTHGGLLSGLPYIDPNEGFTTQALGHLAAEDWLHGVIPWWNPYWGCKPKPSKILSALVTRPRGYRWPPIRPSASAEAPAC